ncbi:MAG: hypothetical protein ABH967_00810 [Patescibacteria group bacterium]
MSLSKGKSFKLEIRKEHVIIFKIFLPVVLFYILIQTSFFFSKTLFNFLYYAEALLTIFYIYYVYRFYIKNASFIEADKEKLKNISFFKFFKAKNAYYVSMAFYLINLLLTAKFKSYNFLLGFFSFLLGISAFSTEIVIRDFLAQRKISIIKIITILIVTSAYFIFRYKG